MKKVTLYPLLALAFSLYVDARPQLPFLHSFKKIAHYITGAHFKATRSSVYRISQGELAIDVVYNKTLFQHATLNHADALRKDITWVPLVNNYGILKPQVAHVVLLKQEHYDSLFRENPGRYEWVIGKPFNKKSFGEYVKYAYLKKRK